MAKPLLAADPARLSLPPLAEGEEVRADGPRVAQALAGKVQRMGPFFGLLGSADIRGRGSDSENSPHCDPFMLCHTGSLPPGAKPPFCAHPHCGASVATISVTGSKMSPWDNVQGTEAKPLLPGGIYHVQTGSGCVHDEPMDPIDVTPRTRAGFGDGGASVALPGGPSQLMQLWWNSIDPALPAGSPLPGVRTQVLLPEEVPVVACGDLRVRVLAGDFGGNANVLTSAAYPILLLHVLVPAEADVELTGLPVEFNGFMWLWEGAVTVGDGDDALLTAYGDEGMRRLPPGGTSLRLRGATGEGAADAELLVALGMPQRKPYYKYVGYGGGFIHRTVEEVEAAMADYESNPKQYGCAVAGSSGCPEEDLQRFDLVGGFQDNGGEMMERPDGIVARFAYAPAPEQEPEPEL